MHGLLNVFVGAALIYAGMSEPDLVAILNERDPEDFHFASSRVRWRNYFLDDAPSDTARPQ